MRFAERETAVRQCALLNQRSGAVTCVVRQIRGIWTIVPNPNMGHNR